MLSQAERDALYMLRDPLPEGFAPMRIEPCGTRGALGVQRNPFTGADCDARLGGIVAGFASDWRTGMPAIVVEVRLRPLVHATNDARWLRALYHERTGARGTATELRRVGGRVWRDETGRHAEWLVRSSCCGGDRITRLIHHVERDGRVLEIDLAIYDFVPAERLAELRRLFVEGPLAAGSSTRD